MSGGGGGELGQREGVEGIGRWREEKGEWRFSFSWVKVLKPVTFRFTLQPYKHELDGRRRGGG